MREDRLARSRWTIDSDDTARAGAWLRLTNSIRQIARWRDFVVPQQLKVLTDSDGLEAFVGTYEVSGMTIGVRLDVASRTKAVVRFQFLAGSAEADKLVSVLGLRGDMSLGAAARNVVVWLGVTGLTPLTAVPF